MKIIAELAQGFEGNLKQAKLLLKAASSSGADIVKFQLVYADELAVSDYNYYSLFKDLEMSNKDWNEIFNYSKELGIDINFDIFGTKSLRLCEKIGVSGVKIHGTDITNISLIKEVSKSKIKNVFLGAGGSNLDEIKIATSILKKKNIIILLGFQSYPTPDIDNQISRVSYLKKIFNSKNIKIGFADHADPESKLSFALAATAVGAGATFIEKHLTLGKVMKMEDHESALNPDEFKDFVETINNCYLSLGDISESNNDFNMSKSEKKYRNIIRRHVVASKDLKKGSTIRPIDVCLKRTGEKNGIYDLNEVYNKLLKVDVKINTPIIKNMIIQQ